MQGESMQVLGMFMEGNDFRYGSNQVYVQFLGKEKLIPVHLCAWFRLTWQDRLLGRQEEVFKSKKMQSNWWNGDATERTSSARARDE